MVVQVVGQTPAALKHTTCHNCAAALTYTAQDTFLHRYSACGSMETDLCIRCPSCGQVLDAKR